jgi:hypothetical protein
LTDNRKAAGLQHHHQQQQIAALSSNKAQQPFSRSRAKMACLFISVVVFVLLLHAGWNKLGLAACRTTAKQEKRHGRAYFHKLSTKHAGFNHTVQT